MNQLALVQTSTHDEPVAHAPSTMNAARKQLLSMLTYKRPHQSQGEKDFVDAWLPMCKDGSMIYADPTGEIAAYEVQVGEFNAMMFSSHVDSVHKTSGVQTVEFLEDVGVAVTSNGAKECLGADDAAGVWVMLQMIEAGVPGTYVFHRGEECGGLGSRAMAKHYPKWLSRFKWAIAFDRRGDASVITHQAGTRCCSDGFAVELSARLVARGLDFMEPDDGGMFTDTANYTDSVPECTNISVGYNKEHTADERLDVFFLEQLRDACCDPTTWENLPALRDPTIVEELEDYWANRGWNGFSSAAKTDEEDEITGLGAQDFLAMTEKGLAELVITSYSDDVASVIQDLAWQIGEAQMLAREWEKKYESALVALNMLGVDTADTTDNTDTKVLQ